MLQFCTAKMLWIFKNFQFPRKYDGEKKIFDGQKHKYETSNDRKNMWRSQTIVNMRWNCIEAFYLD